MFDEMRREDGRCDRFPRGLLLSLLPYVRPVTICTIQVHFICDTLSSLMRHCLCWAPDDLRGCDTSHVSQPSAHQIEERGPTGSPVSHSGFALPAWETTERAIVESHWPETICILPCLAAHY
nr:hypothetical protein CFP56_30919 [Quercus suber]